MKSNNSTIPFEKQIEILEDNLEAATKMFDIRMKSIVQTYDIRDSPELKGCFEIEVML